MASGRTHSVATLLSAMCGVLQVPTDSAGVAWIAGSLYGLLSQPDLDQIENIGQKDGGYYGQYIIRETCGTCGNGKVGEFAERFWWLYWQGYARLFSHRSLWTHFPVIGTSGRMIYGFPHIVFFYILLHEQFAYFIIALMVSDILHWVMDWKAWRKLGFFKQ